MPIIALFIHRDLDFHGGVPQSFYTVARYRDPERLQMYVASFRRASRHLSQRFEEAGTTVYHLGESYPQAILALRRLIRAKCVNVIVAGSFRSMVVARIAALNHPCQVVFWVPAIPIMNGRFRRVTYRMLAKDMDLIFISHAVAAAHSYSRHRGRTDVLYHGIRDHLSLGEKTGTEDIRAELGIPQDAMLVGYVAEFTPWKDHFTILHAFDAIAGQEDTIHLLLIGTGSTIGTNRTLAASLRHGDRIHFLGAREDVSSLYPQMDIYAHPADGEGFGLAVAEAMLAGLPVVAARAGALPEFIHEGSTGLLFAPHDAAELSCQLLRLAASPDLRHRLGSTAREFCIDHFDPNRFAGEMTTLLERTAGYMDRKARPT